MKCFKFFILIFVLCTAQLALKIEAAYSVRDVGTLTTDLSFAFSQNESGTVVGYYMDDESDIFSNFIWNSSSGLQVITTQGSGEFPYINNKGTVAGVLSTTEKVSFFGYATIREELFLYDDINGLKKLGKPAGWDEIDVCGFNDANKIFIMNPDSLEYAVWDNGKFLTIFSNEHVNNKGVFITSNMRGDVVVFNENGLNIIDLSMLKESAVQESHQKDFHEIVSNENGALDNFLFDSKGERKIWSETKINDNREVTGIRKNEKGSIEGYLWSEKNGFISLGNFLPYDLNNQGQLIGKFDNEWGIWENGTFSDINSLISTDPNFGVGFEKLISLTTINDAGQIVALMQIMGELQTVVLEPIKDDEKPYVKAAQEEWNLLSPDEQAWYNVEVDYAIAAIQERKPQ